MHFAKVMISLMAALVSAAPVATADLTDTAVLEAAGCPIGAGASTCQAGVNYCIKVH
jgi:hypothetical protein